MKMGLGLLIGILLILAGIGLILKIIFNIDLPVFKILIGLLFIYLGIKILTGGFNVWKIHPGNNSVIFGETYFKGLPEDNEYSIIFGYAKIDLSDTTNLKRSEKIEIHTIFGSTDLIIDPKSPVKIDASAAFGSIVLPENEETAFGSASYISPDYQNAENRLEIEASTVFGKFQVIQKN